MHQIWSFWQITWFQTQCYGKWCIKMTIRMFFNLLRKTSIFTLRYFFLELYSQNNSENSFIKYSFIEQRFRCNSKMSFPCNRNFDFWYHFCLSDMSFRHTHQVLFTTSWKFGKKKYFISLWLSCSDIRFKYKIMISGDFQNEQKFIYVSPTHPSFRQ